MKFVQCEIEEIGGLKKYSNNYKILMKFIESNIPCARLENWTHVNAGSCQNSLITSIKRYKLNQVGVSIRDGKVYLIRKDI